MQKSDFRFIQFQILAKYRNTLIGAAWSLIHPLLLILAPVIVFNQLLGQQDEYYKSYLLTGLTIWYYFSQHVEKISSNLQNFSHYWKNLDLNLEKLTWLSSLELHLNLIVYSLACSILVMGFSQNAFFWWIQFVIKSIYLFLIAYAFSYLISILQLLFKDTKYLAQFVLSSLYFLSPVFYKKEAISPQFNWLVQINPFTWVLDFSRLNLSTFDWTLIVCSLKALLLLTIIFILKYIFTQKLMSQVQQRL